MKIQDFCDVLKTRLCPRVYRTQVSMAGSFRLLLQMRQFILSRYPLAVYEWDRTVDGVSQLCLARREIARALWAFPIFGQIGLYLVFCGPEEEWAPHVASMPADQTGLHIVIVQGVHFVDLTSGARDLNQSAWEPVRFGGVDSVASEIEQTVAERHSGLPILNKNNTDGRSD